MKNVLREIVFIKFFRHLFQSAPKLFYLCASFIIIQLILLAMKLEVTPFFLYGMYSEKIAYSDTIFIRKILLNKIEIAEFPIPSRSKDVLETGLDNYMILKKNNHTDIVKTRVENKYPFFTTSFVYPLIKEKIYNPLTSTASFEKWFKEKGSAYAKQNINEVIVLQDVYYIHPVSCAPSFIKKDTLARF